MTTYHTIERSGEGFFKDRGSKFFSFAFPVTTQEEIKERLQDVRKQYHDARHHCYAFSLGMKTPQLRANDDGEPGHSAGDPILGQIKSLGLTNVLVVVVRYFGGTKLGVAGLINAYRTAAADALQSIAKTEIFPEVTFQLTYTYEETNEAERLLATNELRIIDRAFDHQCEVTAAIREELFPEILALTQPPSSLKLDIIEPEDSKD